MSVQTQAASLQTQVASEECIRLNGSCEEGEWRLERGREAVGTRRGSWEPEEYSSAKNAYHISKEAVPFTDEAMFSDNCGKNIYPVMRSTCAIVFT